MVQLEDNEIKEEITNLSMNILRWKWILSENCDITDLPGWIHNARQDYQKFLEIIERMKIYVKNK